MTTPHTTPDASPPAWVPHSALNRAVGDRITVERSRRGLTQGQLAYRLAALGWPVAQNVLSKIERDGRRITVDHLAVLAQAFGLTPADLLEPPTFEELRAAVRRAAAP